MTNDPLQKVKAPAVALLITGILNAGFGLIALASGAFRLSGIGSPETIPTDENERLGFIIGTALGYGIAAISLLLAPVIFIGALKMMRGKGYGISMSAAILAILPVTSCCFLIGIPAGIWAIVVLRNPEVKSFFKGTFPSGNFYPPPPQMH
ncbi:MAG: hypothetical protein ACT4O9_04040 [Blastocatellia bacterium]